MGWDGGRGWGWHPIAVVMFTADITPETRADALRAGATDFLQKPAPSGGPPTAGGGDTGHGLPFWENWLLARTIQGMPAASQPKYYRRVSQPSLPSLSPRRPRLDILPPVRGEGANSKGC